MATLNGIDISSWQTGIDLSAVPADFVLVKATEATNYVNPDCDRAFQQAARAGKLLGIYHFARPGDARAQADFFISKCRVYIGRAILVLDWEANALPLGPAWAKAWLDRVHQVTGIRPLIYMSASVTGQYDWTAVVKANYGLWVAAYALGYQRIDGYRVPSGPKGVKHWPTVSIWQYTSSGRLTGWGGKLDLNIFYGDRAAWAKCAGGAPASGAYVPPVKPVAQKGDTTNTDTTTSQEDSMIFENNGRFGIYNPYRREYQFAKSKSDLEDMKTVITRTGGTLKEWKALGSKSNKIDNLSALGSEVK